MKIIAFLLSLPLAAQSLSLNCLAPQKQNQPAVCSLSLVPAGQQISALQWKFTATTPLTPVSTVSGKTISGSNGTWILVGLNSTTMSGIVATIAVPAHSGTVTGVLSNIVGSTPDGHAVQVNPGASITLQ